MSRMHRTPLYSLVLCCAISAGVGLGQTKKTVNTAADLPRFSYPLTQPASRYSKPTMPRSMFLPRRWRPM